MKNTATRWLVLAAVVSCCGSVCCRSKNERLVDRLLEDRQKRLHLAVSTEQKLLLGSESLAPLPWLDAALRTQEGSWPALQILSLVQGSRAHAVAPYRIGFEGCGNISDDEICRWIVQDISTSRAAEDAAIASALNSQAPKSSQFPVVEWSNPEAIESLLVSAVVEKRYGLIYVLLSDYRDYQRGSYYQTCSSIDSLADHVLVDQVESHYSGDQNATTATFTASRGGEDTIRWRLQYRIDDDDADGLHEVSVFRRL